MCVCMTHWRRQEFSFGAIVQVVGLGAKPRWGPGKLPQKLKQFADLHLQILTAESIKI